jgi:methylated-DNA-[protein]-cysteine S-methyltransferase
VIFSKSSPHLNEKSISMGYISSPIGALKVELFRGKICSICYNKKKKKDSVLHHDRLVFEKAKTQIQAYFAGKLKKFDLPLVAEGTDFQQQVWGGMAKIPYGTTCTYGELAKAIGCPLAARAIGNACNGNRHLIVVPCHRVVGANNIGGFAIGAEKKMHLLNLEMPT